MLGRSIPYQVVDLDQGEALPDNPNSYGAVVVCGGPDSANDDTDKMKEELAFISKVLEANLPYIGVCLGLQALVKAAGGRVIKSPLKEVGFKDPEGAQFEIELTTAGMVDPLFKSLETPFDVFHLHGETVEITNTMSVLGTGKHCTNQIVKVGESAYGIQCHFELTLEMFEVWLQEDADLLELDSSQLKKDFAAIQDSYTQTGNTLFTNFLNIAGY